MLPMLILCVPLLFPDRGETLKSNLPDGTKKNLLFWLAFGPLILAFLISLIMGARFKDMWGMPMLAFIPLWLVARRGVHIEPIRLAVFFSFWNVIAVLCMVAFAISQLFAHDLGYRPLRSSFPGRQLSQEIHSLWEKKTGTKLTLLGGDAWPAGNVALYSPTFHDRPQVLLQGNFAISPWVTEADIRQKGMALVWEISKNQDVQQTRADLLKAFPQASIQKPLTLQPKTVLGVIENALPIHIGWAIVKPTRK
jgi:hypothetical protein